MALCICASIPVVLLRSPASPADWWMVLLLLGLGVGLPLWTMIATHYTLDSKLLIVQSGPFKWRVPIIDITTIAPTKSPISSPALSRDRLRIDYGRSKTLMISPRDKEKFLRDIEALRRDAA
jgi:hypothetical protein